MPLKFLREGNPVFAFDFSLEDWEALKVESRKHKHLSMPCCDAKATPKTSKLGNHFVAHARVENCAASTETAEHILAKTTVAQAARLAGWDVDIEVPGCTPGGESWVADVLATRGSAKVAIEVQWSRQTLDETKRRQERYKQSGVRCLWLLRHLELVVEKETPTFRLRYEEVSRKFVVMIPSPLFDLAWVHQRNKNEPKYWQQQIDLTTFVVGALTGALKFAPAVGQRIPMMVSTVEIACWQCKQQTRTVLEVEFGMAARLPGYENISAQLYDFERLDDGGAFLAAAFPKKLLWQHGIGVIKRRYSRTAGKSYLSNGCFHCDVLQGRFFDQEYKLEAKLTYTIEVELSHQLAKQLPGSELHIFFWWFNHPAVAG
ncbi:competence protein CoiA [Chitinimonas sp. PSY-7]|uniref:competence protein CoiA family protein n=1 Tax=Chitinimonas sp. PSY-7 TaxID=3459088 RepID=UPI00403FC978